MGTVQVFTTEEKKIIAEQIHKAVDELNRAVIDALKANLAVNIHLNRDGLERGACYKAVVFEINQFNGENRP